MIFNITHVIDVFALHHDEEPSPRLVCHGWIHASRPVARMSVEVGPSLSLPIEAFQLPSPDVAAYAGADADAARFRLECRVDPTGLDLTASRLVVELEGGHGIIVPLAEHLAVHRERPRADRDLVMRFESLGDNCEFGLLQRAIGTERLGLLRYGGARTIEHLVEAIDNGFDAFATSDDLELSPFGVEWVARSRRYGFTFHTRMFVDQKAEADARADEAVKLSFMKDMLLEDLETDRKCFVRRSNEGDPEAGLWELHRAIRARGPGRLLWVTPPSAGEEPGTVRKLADGLYRGFHPALAPYGNAGGFDEELWLALLRNAETAMAGTEALDPPAAPPAPLRDGWWRRLLAPRAARTRELA